MRLRRTGQDLLAEESNSSFDIRNKIAGNFVYELPFGLGSPVCNDRHSLASS